jgi:hypothetical protein
MISSWRRDNHQLCPSISDVSDKLKNYKPEE